MYNLCLLFHTGLSDMHNYFAVGKEFVSLESLGKLKQLWAAVSTHSDLDVRKDGHIDVCACVCVWFTSLFGDWSCFRSSLKTSRAATCIIGSVWQLGLLCCCFFSHWMQSNWMSTTGNCTQAQASHINYAVNDVWVDQWAAVHLPKHRHKYSHQNEQPSDR